MRIFRTPKILRILKNNVRIRKKYFVDPLKVLEDPQKICGYLQNFCGAKYPHFLFCGFLTCVVCAPIRLTHVCKRSQSHYFTQAANIPSPYPGDREDTYLAISVSKVTSLGKYSRPVRQTSSADKGWSKRTYTLPSRRNVSIVWCCLQSGPKTFSLL